MTRIIIVGIVIGIIIASVIIEKALKKEVLDRKIREMMAFEPDDFSDSGSELNK